MGNSRGRRKLRRLLQEQGLSMPRKSPAPKSKAVSISFWKKIPHWIYYAVVFLTLVITSLEGYPWLSIQRSGMLYANNPYSEMFEISNSGYIPLTHLTAVCIPRFQAAGL